MKKSIACAALTMALATVAAGASFTFEVLDFAVSRGPIHRDSVFTVRYALRDRGPGELKTSIQMIDHRGHVLYASPWQSAKRDGSGLASVSWSGAPLRHLLLATEASRIYLNVWVEQFPQHIVVARRTFERVHRKGEPVFECADCENDRDLEATPPNRLVAAKAG